MKECMNPPLPLPQFVFIRVYRDFAKFRKFVVKHFGSLPGEQAKLPSQTSASSTVFFYKARQMHELLFCMQISMQDLAVLVVSVSW